jgi:hypothetical protein
MNEMLIAMADRGLLPLGALLLAILLIANEVGFRIGRSRAASLRAREKDETNLNMLTAGLIGLLAFTLGLSISIAESRFEARRDQVVTEANAIGTAWYRAALIAGEPGTKLRQDIEAYARLRLDFAQAGPEPARIAAINAETNAAQARIWQVVQEAAQRAPTPITASVIASMNEMFDASLAQRYAFESQVPGTVLLLLLFTSMLAVAAIGFQLGFGPQRHLMLSVLLMTVWVAGMLLIVDLSRPRQGTIRAEVAPLVWTLQGFGTTAPR